MFSSVDKNGRQIHLVSAEVASVEGEQESASVEGEQESASVEGEQECEDGPSEVGLANGCCTWSSRDLPEDNEQFTLAEFEARVKTFANWKGFRVKISKTYPPFKDRVLVQRRCFSCTSSHCKWKIWVKRTGEHQFVYGTQILRHNHSLSPLTSIGVRQFVFEGEAEKLIGEHVKAGTPTCVIHRFMIEHFHFPFHYETLYNFIRRKFGHVSPWDDGCV
jgi:hypothetical protein